MSAERPRIPRRARAAVARADVPSLRVVARDRPETPPATDHGVIPFGPADERFIDFLVEEAVKAWRAKNW